MTMPCQIKRHDAQALQLRRQPGKAVGVVEPAMQGNHRLAVLGAVKVSSQFDMPQIETDFLHGKRHAVTLEAPRAYQRASSVLSSNAVSSGRSRKHVPSRHGQVFAFAHASGQIAMMRHDHPAVFAAHHGQRYLELP